MANDSIKQVNKDNVWSNNYIDDFKQMIDNHHKSLNSFQKVGTMLEKSSHIYGLKVDSLHNDVLRLSSGIRRQNITEPTVDNVSDVSSIEISSHSVIRRRRPRTTIAGNKDAINTPLQTVQQPCYLWNRLNYEGSVTGAKNLLQNVLVSDKYSLGVQSKKRLWFADRDEDANVENVSESMIVNSTSVELPVLNWMPCNSDRIRQKLSGYSISDTPREHFRYSETSTDANVDRLEYNDNPIFDDSSMDLQFDVNADVVPVSDPIVMIPEINFNSFTEDDQNALRRCSALQRNTLSEGDLRPVTCSPLEYSYRRLTDLPLPTDTSHWKLPAMVNQENSTVKKKRRRKIRVRDEPVACKMRTDTTLDQKFISIDDPLVNRVKKSNQTKWDQNKLKMPSRLPYSSAKLFLPSMIHCMENDDHDDDDPVVPDEPNMDLASDESDSNSFHIDGNMDWTPIENGSNGMDEVIVSNDIDVVDIIMTPMTPGPVPQQALQPLPLVQLASQNIDVKSITAKCFEIICEFEADGGIVTFGKVYHRLQTNSQVISPSVTLFVILELANQNNLNLEKIGENDFNIKRM